MSLACPAMRRKRLHLPCLDGRRCDGEPRMCRERRERRRPWYWARCVMKGKRGSKGCAGGKGSGGSESSASNCALRRGVFFFFFILFTALLFSLFSFAPAGPA